jgi:peptidoglycan/xylan/chitin deacetylase (PgdA/CDA1 family)
MCGASTQKIRTMSRFPTTDNMSRLSQLPILMCHDISDQRAVTALSAAVFQSGLARLNGAGFQTVSLEELAQSLRATVGQSVTGGPRSLPEQAFAITFDDGWQSVYTQAFPVLQQLGFSATVFLTVGDKSTTAPEARLPSSPGRTMLTWGQIRDMHRHGIAFGAHTLTHPNLTRLPPDRAEAEICTSQAVIADALGVAVPTFAYPFGYYNDCIRDIVRRYFTCACSVRLGLVSARSDLYALERVDTHYLRTERLFALMVSPWFPWYVRARAIPRRIRRGLAWRMG